MGFQQLFESNCGPTGNKMCFIGCLPQETKAQDLQNFFSCCAGITEMKILKYRRTGTSTGFAFATFQDEGSMKAAIQHGHGKEFLGRKITAIEATRQDRTSKKIIVRTRWNPPTDKKIVVINTDGSYNEKEKRGGYGYIIRDSSGELICAVAAMVAPESDIIHEIQPIKFAIEEAKNRQFKDVMIISDSANVVSYINGDPADCPEDLKPYIQDINTLKTDFNSIKFESVYREANRPADFLSKHVKGKGQSSKTFSNISSLPADIKDAVESDQRGTLFHRGLEERS